MKINRRCEPERIAPDTYVTDCIRALQASVVASAHGPALRGAQVGAAPDMMATLPGLPAVPLPGQAQLEALVAMVTGGQQAA